MTSPTPTRGPCSPWDPIFCATFPVGTSPSITGSALMSATEILYNLSAQLFSICEFTVRPCRQSCAGMQGWPWLGGWWQWGGMYGGWPTPYLYNGNWYNLTCGNCPGSCSCTVLEKAFLPSPVASITQVKLNGAVMPPTAYRVDNFRELMRTDGGSWPICQDLNAPDTANNTWSVTVKVGETPPVTAQFAVGELTQEIVASCTGAECRIPRRTTQISRQGVTVDFVTLSDLLKQGLLGLPFCDTFVTAYNPRGLRARPQVYDVDGEAFRRAGT